MTSAGDEIKPTPNEDAGEVVPQKICAIQICEGGEPLVAIFNEENCDEWVEAEENLAVELEEMR